MRLISLKNTSLTYFDYVGKCSELSGSSRYNVYNGVIELKEKSKTNKYESLSAVTDLINHYIDTNSEHEIVSYLKRSYDKALDYCLITAFNIEEINKTFEIYSNESSLLHFLGVIDYIALKKSLSLKNDHNTPYFKDKIERSKEKSLNKSKVKGKMYALFNLKCSHKFIAFYSISFPLNTTDDTAFICFNQWLTKCRKLFSLENYIWVTERQKNGTIHYHMLTNNYLPIIQVNKLMALIINNQVNNDLMTWGNSSLSKYNGVDVDAIFNSKRHKTTGKNFTKAEIRNWISKYVTKYVTKNSEIFTHLCWHCSRSISSLFISTIIELKDSFSITSKLPTIRNMYFHIKSEYCDIWLFNFVPPDELFDKIKMYNDLIFGEHIPQAIKHKSIINFKTTTL